MNPRTTLTLIALAAGLFVFIFFVERHLERRTLPEEAMRALPELAPEAVTTVQIRPAGQLEIRADRTNNTWRLTKPIVYPAQPELVGRLLRALAQLDNRTKIMPQELKDRQEPEREFGLDPPGFSIILLQAAQRIQVHVGRLSPLRDRVYVRIVGKEGIFAADASLLNFIPRSADDWRNTALVTLAWLSFDRVLVMTNGTKVFELAWHTNTKAWRLCWPIDARADSPRIDDLLQKLERTRVVQFVTDSPDADLDLYGLEQPTLELMLNRGTNMVAHLQFGASPANDPAQIYARRVGQTGIVLVPAESIDPWRARFDEFRDRRLVRLPPEGLDSVEVRAEDTFRLQLLSNNQWQIVGTTTLPADPWLVQHTLGSLEALEVVQFVKYVVTEHDLPSYGLEPPSREFILRTAATNGPTGVPNGVIAHLMFGGVQGDKIFVRRGDENSVYAVRLFDYLRLPWASWQLRDRRVWSFNENDVARVLIREQGKLTELRRTGTNQWTFAPGSQGIINPFGVEEAVHRLGALTAASWLGTGPDARQRCNFAAEPDSITVETKKGARFTLELGGLSPRALPCAAVTLDGQPWVFELHPQLFDYIQTYLRIGNNPP